MNTIKQAWPVAMILFAGIGCQSPTSETTIEALPLAVEVKKTHHTEPQFYKNGKTRNAKKLNEVYTASDIHSLTFPSLSEEVIDGLENQLKALKLKKNQSTKNIAGLEISIEQLERTIEILLDNIQHPTLPLNQQLNAHQIWGKDKKGHVKFTGYYAPEIRVKKEADARYQYPIYSKPKNWEGDLPTRTQIDGEGALEGLGLELGYAENLADIYYLQLQGSGYVKFIDTGEKKMLRFAGGNGYRYRSIERFIMDNEDIRLGDISEDGIKSYLRKNPQMVEYILFSNPSYTFFRLSNTKIKGAAGVALSKDMSIAVDPKYIPIGSVLLAAMPDYNKQGKFIGHEYKLLLAQDVGGAIRGAGHVDVYSGVGTRGKLAAGARHHYGQMWLLLPKEYEQLAMR